MIVRKVQDKIYMIDIKTDQESFMKKNNTGGFFIVDQLPFSKFKKWKIVNNEIVVDEEAEQEIIAKMYEREIEQLLNNTAKIHKYDSIDTACSYASVENPFQEESKLFVAWRGNLWAYCYQIISDVKDKKRTIPSLDELMTELPKFENQAELTIM